MKIALVTPEFVSEKQNFDGGLANYINRLAISLESLGHKPIIIVASDKNDYIKHNNIDVYRVNVKKHPLFILSNIFYFISRTLKILIRSYLMRNMIKKIYKNEKIDIIQYPSFQALSFFSIREVPFVIRISAYQKIWNRIYKHSKFIDTKICNKIEDISYKRVKNIFGPSKNIARMIQKSLSLENKIKVIETPFTLDIDREDFSISNKIVQQVSNNRYLLFFGTLGVLKGIKEIGEIIYQLFQKFPDTFFVFVGKRTKIDGIDSLEYLKQKAAEHVGKVIYFSQMPHSQLYPIIKNSYGVILPSRIDNLPNTCIESMAMRKVVIGTRGASFEQLIDDKVSGFLCEIGDSKSLLGKIQELMLLNDKEKEKIEEKAYNRILELRPEKVVKELIEYYKNIIENFNNTKLVKYL